MSGPINLLRVNDPRQSDLFVRSLIAATLFFAVIISFVVIASLTGRMAILYLGTSAALAVPIAYLLDLRMRRVGLVLSAVTLAFAVGPLDYVVHHTGRLRIRLLPASTSLRCPPETECYGSCVAPTFPPNFAIVLDY